MSEWIRSYSQCGEDILLWRVLENVSKGFFIDIGAFDPSDDSVTRIFYDAGWAGINIEPNPVLFTRFVEDRPRDINLSIAVSDQNAELELNLIGETGLTTLVADVAERHQSNGWLVEKINVPTRPLADIWDEYMPNGQDVHFLKIDVEGAEEAVIRGADWSRHRPWIVIVEALEPNSTVKSHQNWDPLLQEVGYEFVNFDGLNRYYVARERPEFIEPLRAPLNFITHRYVPFALHQAQDESARLNAQCGQIQTELAINQIELAAAKQDLANTQRELSQLHDVMQRRPRPIWEMLIFRKSGRPKKIFRRILFHKSGKPRGIFRKWILLPDRRPRAVFHLWMNGADYQAMRRVIKLQTNTQHIITTSDQLPTELSARALFMKRQLTQAIQNGREK